MSDLSAQPQDAFAELAAVVLSDHSLASIMKLVAKVAKRIVPGAVEVSVTMLERGHATTVAATGPLAVQLDERQYEDGYGPCLAAVQANEIVHIPQMSTEQRWPGYAQEAVRAGVGSLLSVPVPVQREVAAGLNIYGGTDHAFEDDSLELIRTLAAYAGVALANMHLYEAQARVAEQLQEAMQSRAVIEQAKGVLMAQQRCSATDAFNLLVVTSQRSNRKLRDVAAEIVAEVERRAGS